MIERPRSRGVEERFQLRERLFDPIEIGTIGRQEPQARAALAFEPFAPGFRGRPRTGKPSQTERIATVQSIVMWHLVPPVAKLVPHTPPFPSLSAQSISARAGSQGIARCACCASRLGSNPTLSAISKVSLENNLQA